MVSIRHLFLLILTSTPLVTVIPFSNKRGDVTQKRIIVTVQCFAIRSREKSTGAQGTHVAVCSLYPRGAGGVLRGCIMNEGEENIS